MFTPLQFVRHPVIPTHTPMTLPITAVTALLFGKEPIVFLSNAPQSYMCTCMPVWESSILYYHVPYKMLILIQYEYKQDMTIHLHKSQELNPMHL